MARMIVDFPTLAMQAAARGDSATRSCPVIRSDPGHVLLLSIWCCAAFIRYSRKKATRLPLKNSARFTQY